MTASPLAAAPGAAVPEKRSVALSSLLAAALLTGLKIAVGIATGSLGILSEAAHSGLDLVAAVITYVSVRVSDKPADRAHPFGHGKVENLSAFIQTALLFVTSAWIVYEAVRRLVVRDVHVAPSVWAFAVLFVSVTVDSLRSRALFRAARKYDSQALEADALHFSTDIYSTSVVILGLGCIYAARQSGLTWLQNADPAAALVVAGFSLYVGLRLGNRTLGALLDAAPEGVTEGITEAVARVPGVLQQDRIRVRRSGNKLFVELRLVLESNIALEHAQSVVHAVGTAVRARYPNADVVVDATPRAPSSSDLVERMRSVAHTGNFQIHNVTAFRVGGRVSATLDLEIDPALSLATAHEQATRLERTILQDVPEVHHVNVHIEPLETRVASATEVPRAQTAVERTLRKIVRTTPGVLDCHAVEVRQVDDHMVVAVHCLVQSGLSVAQVHELTERLELQMRERFPEIHTINIHPEPQ